MGGDVGQFFENTVGKANKELGNLRDDIFGRREPDSEVPPPPPAEMKATDVENATQKAADIQRRPKGAASTIFRNRQVGTDLSSADNSISAYRTLLGA